MLRIEEHKGGVENGEGYNGNSGAVIYNLKSLHLCNSQQLAWNVGKLGNGRTRALF